MNRFIYGRTEYCCVCYKIAVHYNGWLIKSRDAVVAGFCDEHAPTEPNLKGTYGSTITEVSIIKKWVSLQKN